MKTEKKDWEYQKLVNMKYNILVPIMTYRLMIFYIILMLAGIVTLGIVTINTISDNVEKDEYIKELLHERTSDKHLISIHNHIGQAVLERKLSYTQEDLYAYVDELDVWYPEIIKAQIALESSNGISSLAKQTNNLFGMKKVYTRNTTQELTDYNTYGVYKNYKLSIIDRVLWDYHIFTSKPDKDEYINTLKMIYAEDKNYIDKLINIINNGI